MPKSGTYTISVMIHPLWALSRQPPTSLSPSRFLVLNECPYPLKTLTQNASRRYQSYAAEILSRYCMETTRGSRILFQEWVPIYPENTHPERVQHRTSIHIIRLRNASRCPQTGGHNFIPNLQDCRLLSPNRRTHPHPGWCPHKGLTQSKSNIVL
mgnify:CR=1 FL=1